MIEGMKVPSKMLNSAIQIASGMGGGASLKLATKFPEESILNVLYSLVLGKNRFDRGLEFGVDSVIVMLELEFKSLLTQELNEKPLFGIAWQSESNFIVLYSFVGIFSLLQIIWPESMGLMLKLALTTRSLVLLSITDIVSESLFVT